MNQTDDNKAAEGGSSPLICSVPSVQDDPDSILELFPDGCPKCGSKRGLEALTWESRGSDAVTVGCWDCDWMIEPPDAENLAFEFTAPKCQRCGRIIMSGELAKGVCYCGAEISRNTEARQPQPND